MLGQNSFNASWYWSVWTFNGEKNIMLYNNIRSFGVVLMVMVSRVAHASPESPRGGQPGWDVVTVKVMPQQWGHYHSGGDHSHRDRKDSHSEQVCIDWFFLRQLVDPSQAKCHHSMIIPHDALNVRVSVSGFAFAISTHFSIAMF